MQVLLQTCNASDGSIGYVEYAYAKKNNIPYVQLKNKSGKYVKPSDASFKAAAAGAQLEENCSGLSV